MDIKNQTDISFFAPCYNEEHSLINTLDTIVKVTQRFPELTFETIIVDDGSTDATFAKAEEYIKNNQNLDIVLYRNKTNMGLARGFVDAAFRGKGKYFRQVNGDNDETVESIAVLLTYIGKADIIIPYHLDATVRGTLRKNISSTFTLLINFITGNKVKYYNGLPVFLREHVLRWHSRTNGYGYQAELVTNLLSAGYSYYEVGVIPITRQAGESKAFTFRNFLSISHTLTKLVLQRLSQLYYDRFRRKVRLP